LLQKGWECMTNYSREGPPWLPWGRGGWTSTAMHDSFSLFSFFTFFTYLFLDLFFNF